MLPRPLLCGRTCLELRSDLYIRANRQLIAKSIGELYYEELLRPTEIAAGSYRLTLGDINYEFQAELSIWDSLVVQENSIKRVPQTQLLSAAQFFIDIKDIHKMGDITLGNFLEELANTLAREVEILKKRENITSSTLLELPETELQSYLSGHPKILLNKGRIGWGSEDSFKFSPEAAPRFKLHWVALKKTIATHAWASGEDMDTILNESMNPAELARFCEQANRLGASEKDYFYLPVHPWQWDHVIKIQFAHEFATGNLIELGVYGDEYSPQVSLRTLTNRSRDSRLDIKLPLTILNTSAIRGLPAAYIKAGVELSDFVEDLATKDEILNQAGLSVLKERAGIAYTNEHYQQVKGAPYRYHEFLGATWRESATCKAKSADQEALMTGALLFVDESGKTLISTLIERSGYNSRQWLRAYFTHVVLPLYHLQMKHGLGLVSHGQNIVLRMKNSLPCGVFIKDFGGDLRVSSNFKGKYQDIKGMSALTSLPPTYLIHDLYTGHFITTLRYLSGAMKLYDELSELDFYRECALVIEDYISNNPIGDAPNILAPTFERVLINAVRFDIGYGDSAQRPVPKLGSALNNPLYLALSNQTKSKGATTHE